MFAHKLVITCKICECVSCSCLSCYSVSLTVSIQFHFFKYIRIENKTKTSDFIQYLYDERGWGLEMPQLIISVTGGAQNFSIPQRMKAAFKRGLIKAATSTGAWIITGGTNAGVMKLVGEAVADDANQLLKRLTVIGIATWGKIAKSDELIVNILFYSYFNQINFLLIDYFNNSHQSNRTKMGNWT